MISIMIKMLSIFFAKLLTFSQFLNRLIYCLLNVNVLTFLEIIMKLFPESDHSNYSYLVTMYVDFKNTLMLSVKTIHQLT